MVLVMKRSLKENEVKEMLRKRRFKRSKKKTLASFFGKLPKIEDGLKYQKRVRNEWK
jgi:hypothetical protein